MTHLRNWNSGLLLVVLVAGCGAESTPIGEVAPSETGQELSTSYAPYSEVAVPGSNAFSGTRVQTILVDGNRVYVGGKFTVGGLSNLVAFQLPEHPRDALQLVTDFKPNPNGTVSALAVDGNNLYVGGEFTKLNYGSGTGDDKSHSRLASLNKTTGADNNLNINVTSSLTCYTCGKGAPWDGQPGVKAFAIVPSGGLNYLVLGGNFATVGGLSRPGLASISLSTGKVSQSKFTTGVEGGFVNALLWNQSLGRLFVAGTYNKIQGVARNCLAPTDATGTVLGSSGEFDILPAPNDPNSGVEAYAHARALAMDSSGRLLVGVGGRYVMGANTVQAFNGATGANQWRSNGVAGDVQAIDEHDGAVFFGFHDGLFRDKGDGTLPGDPYKVASLNASNGVLLSDPTHGSSVCGPEDPENCWAPRSVNVAASMWGVVALAHYTSGSGTRLLVGGEVRQWESGGSPVTNSGFFTSFPSVKWTAWLDRDDPSGNGDGEHLSIFVSEGKVCANPQAVECRRISDGVPANQTGEVLTCSTSAGLVCLNADQGDRYCDDYEVRFVCAD